MRHFYTYGDIRLILHTKKNAANPEHRRTNTRADLVPTISKPAPPLPSPHPKSVTFATFSGVATYGEASSAWS